MLALSSTVVLRYIHLCWYVNTTKQIKRVTKIQYMMLMSVSEDSYYSKFDRDLPNTPKRINVKHKRPCGDMFSPFYN